MFALARLAILSNFPVLYYGVFVLEICRYLQLPFPRVFFHSVSSFRKYGERGSGLPVRVA